MKGDNLAARARSLQRPPAAGPDGEPTRPVEPVTRRPRTANVRLSIDLSPRAYRDLTHTASALAERTGRMRVTHVEIVRALIAELVEDPGVFDAIVRRLSE